MMLMKGKSFVIVLLFVLIFLYAIIYLYNKYTEIDSNTKKSNEIREHYLKWKESIYENRIKKISIIFPELSNISLTANLNYANNKKQLSEKLEFSVHSNITNNSNNLYILSKYLNFGIIMSLINISDRLIFSEQMKLRNYSVTIDRGYCYHIQSLDKITIEVVDSIYCFDNLSNLRFFYIRRGYNEMTMFLEYE